MVYFYSNSYVGSSNGISLQYELVDILQRHSCAAKNLIYENLHPYEDIPLKYRSNCIVLSVTRPDITDEDIVIYGETITDNPLNAKNVVRYLMNKPICLTGEEIEYGDTDYIVAYSGLIDKNIPNLFFMRNEVETFSELRKNIASDQDTVAVYFGKVQFGDIIRNFKKIESILAKYEKKTIITRLIPDRRSETLRELRESSLLISFDPLSNINYEATLLGTPVLLVDNIYNVDKDYNINMYGLTTTIDGIEDAKKEVDKAFETYKVFLEEQEDELLKCFEQIFVHFDRINKDKAYREAIAKTNKERREIDEKNFLAFKGIELRNIDTYNCIPKFILKKLNLSFSNRSLKQKILSNLAYLNLYNKCFKLYSKIGFKYKDNGDLTTPQILILLLFRPFFFFRNSIMKFKENLFQKRTLGQLTFFNLVYLLIRRPLQYSRERKERKRNNE